MIQCVEGLDVLDDHLIPGIHVFVAVYVVSGIQGSSMVMAQLGGERGTKKGCPVSGCQTLSFNSPQSHRLYASSVKAEPHFQ